MFWPSSHMLSMHMLQRRISHSRIHFLVFFVFVVVVRKRVSNLLRVLTVPSYSMFLCWSYLCACHGKPVKRKDDEKAATTPLSYSAVKIFRFLLFFYFFLLVTLSPCIWENDQRRDEAKKKRPTIYELNKEMNQLLLSSKQYLLDCLWLHCISPLVFFTMENFGCYCMLHIWSKPNKANFISRKSMKKRDTPKKSNGWSTKYDSYLTVQW